MSRGGEGRVLDNIILQILNGLDKGAAYALIALGLTLIFGTLGVVNFAHGALFMIGAFCAVAFKFLLEMEVDTGEVTKTAFGEQPVVVDMAVYLFGDFGNWLIDWSVAVSILLAIPFMLLIGWIMERGLIQFFYKRPHAEQILVTFGLAIVLGEIIKLMFGADAIPVPKPDALKGIVDIGALFGAEPYTIIYPAWRLVYFVFAMVLIAGVFAFLQFTTFGMVVRAGMADRETVGLLGIDIDKRFTITFAIAATIAGLAGLMYAPIISPNYELGMNYLVLSFVVVVVGGMGSLVGAVLAGFLLGILESLAALPQVTSIVLAIDQIIIYLVAVIVLLLRPRGLMGRKGVMEE